MLRSKHKYIYCIILLIVFLIIGCQKEMALKSPEQIDFDAVPYKTLSEYGFFQGKINQLEPAEQVLLYQPISSLFSDYAHKSRFVWMPKGSAAIILENEVQEIEFPDKSILIKNFYYPEDPKQPDGDKRIIETRLLIKLNGVWEAYPYLWNDQQTDAKYKITGATLPVTFTNEEGKSQQIDYIQPNKNQCKSCHNQDEKLMPIGPKARNLNFNLTYKDGHTKNQLEKWAEVGYLKNFKGVDAYGLMVDYNDIHADLDLRAKAYLDINCGHCHMEKGPGNTSGLFLTYEEKSLMKWGHFKTPVAAGIGAGPHTYDIHPGKADSSILIYRMNSIQPSVMMPEIGRVTIDKAGVALISEWINEMDSDQN